MPSGVMNIQRPSPRNFPHMAKNPSIVRVLVVDDEPLIRWSLGEALRDAGYHVEEAADGQTACERVAQGTPFDVVLLDFRLPDSNDLRLFSTLRQLTPAARIVLMTAYGTADVISDALARGAFRVLSKPFEIEHVASLVSEASGRRPA
jgi:DNA-binding NtrC family response regulator